TGHHGTTAGCLAAIDRLAKTRRIRSALDVGTGSAVLAIAIARRLKVPVLASDIDPVAVRIAAGNVRLNGASPLVRTVCAAGVDRAAFAREGGFDLVVANILAGPLVALAPALCRRLAPAGTLVLSGLLEHQRNRVAAAYRAQGLRFVRSQVREGWVTLTFRRAAGAHA
ncbi:MAG: 50S ribosomal protein L11 methyltransferase, partial [Bauldia sp.]|nr:50S ribosomal protein L11 methyltransferase [Bauldia sp.]